MIEIKLKIFGGLRRFTADLSVEELGIVEVQDGITVEDMIHDLHIPLDKTRIILVNGRPSDLGYKLQSDDSVAIFPAIVGG